MAYASLNQFIAFLEERGELKRIRQAVDPILEIAEIADRAVKSSKPQPALLFENPMGSKFPLLINAYASDQRMAWSLGVENLEEIAQELQELINPHPPQSWGDKLRMLPKLAKVASFMPKKV